MRHDDPAADPPSIARSVLDAARQAGPAAALARLDAGIARHPASAMLRELAGRLLASAGRIDEARGALHHALALDAGLPGALAALAELEFRHGFPSDALPLWERQLALDPVNLDARLKTGETLSRLGEHASAAALFREGLEMEPASPGLWLALGQVLEDDGDRDGATAAYDRALELRPAWPFALACRVSIAGGEAPDSLLDAAAARMSDAATGDGDRALLGYALGKARNARGDAQGAFDAWRQANAARQREAGPPDPAPLQARVARTVAAWTGRALGSGRVRGSDDARPVFIVGMPRSGTTLTEQILAAHPDVHGCGELPDLQLVARRLPFAPDGIDQAMADGAIARYLQAATRHAPAGAARLVDKEPLNFLHLGLVALLFPRARVVWCRRDPRDIAVSIYGENFALDEALSTDLAGIGHYVNAQQRLMRHWQAVTGLPIHVSRYEDLVGDLEARARALLDFLDLPWDPACLAFHAQPQNVQSPSRWQVRQPVHGRSVGRWKRHEPALAPLLDVLEPDAY